MPMMTPLKIRRSAPFKKDLKKAIKQKRNFKKLEAAVNLLSTKQKLSKSYQAHSLSGYWKDYRECHIQPDWLLVYRIDKVKHELLLVRLGSHSELFK